MQISNIEYRSNKIRFRFTRNLYYPPLENYSYGLETARSTNNNQEILIGDRLLIIDSTIEEYETLIDNIAIPGHS